MDCCVCFQLKTICQTSFRRHCDVIIIRIVFHCAHFICFQHRKFCVVVVVVVIAVGDETINGDWVEEHLYRKVLILITTH